ncbi:MAG: GerMN domain-containing protein [Candidatus Omnitrophica bacterium]|nr:GerMN domain-containing protein [Candidatus Omnitrophota bacterium]
MSIQKKIVVGLLVLWVVLVVVVGLIRSGIISSGRVVIYFFQTNQNGKAYLVEVERDAKLSFRTDLSEKIMFALTELIAGPSQEESSKGLISCVPQDARVLSVKKEGDIIYVDFSQEIEYGGGIWEIKGRLAQIVFTSTQFDPDDGVRILIEGKEIKSFSGEGITDVEKPMYRNDFSDFLKGEKNER